MIDNSFIRLEPSLEKGRATRPASVTKIFENSQIQLSPKEFYCQITNTKDGISFDGNYAVYVTDCNGNELRDITNYVAITEFTFEGIPQIVFEIAPIGFDFYRKPVLLKFNHTVSNQVWYSNPILISDYLINETSVFDYRNYEGANAIVDVMQSIRLGCYFDTNDMESEIKEYTRIDGVKVSGRSVITEMEKYVFQKIDNFVFRRLNQLLIEPIVYINGNRATNKQTIGAEDRIGDTNYWNQVFSIPINYNDTYARVPQLFGEFELQTFSPNSVYTLATLPTTINATFNRIIEFVGTGKLKIFTSLGVLVAEYDTATITGDSFEIPLSEIVANGDYYILIESGFIRSIFNEIYSLLNTSVWTFSVTDGEFDSDDFNDEFLIT
jgi:hypothetical protein